MSKRMRTIGGTGGGTPTSGPAVHIGPDFGTTNQAVEEHLSSTFQLSPVYPMTEELSLRPTTFRAGYQMKEELSILGQTQQTLFTKMQKEELSIVGNTQQTLFTKLPKEELSLRPTTFKATYPMQEELHMTGTAKWAPVWVSVNTNTTNGTTLVAVTTPTASTNDLLYTVVTQLAGVGVGVVAPAGWIDISNSTAGNNLHTYYRIVDGTETTNYTWTFSSVAPGTMCIEMHRITGATTVQPDASAGAVGNSTAPAVDAVTGTTKNILLLATMSQNATPAPTIADPAGYTSRTNVIGQSSLAVQNLILHTATKIAASSGAQSSVVFNTGELTGNPWRTQHFVISPRTVTIA